MSLSVTSFYRSKMESTNVNSVVTAFTFNNSLMSSLVVEYGTITRDFTDLSGSAFVVELENAEQIFNGMLTDKVDLLKEGKFEYGFVNDQGSEDLVQFFGGVLIDAPFRRGNVRFTFDNTLSRLAFKIVGTSEAPISFTNTSINPAELAWIIQSSYGGLSAVKSTSNPDVDFPTWETWNQQFVDDNILVQAEFTGEDVLEVLGKIAKLTDSFIYDEGDNKLDYFRWTGVVSSTVQMSDAITTEQPELILTAKNMINKIGVAYGFNPSSNQWAGNVSFQNTDSVNSYSVQEKFFDDTAVWYVDSSAALNFAQRTVFKRKDPNIKGKITTPLKFLDTTAADVIQFTSRVYSLQDLNLVIQGMSLDFNKKEISFDVDEGFGRGAGFRQGFILDDAVNGLLDEDYNFLL